MIWIVFTVAIVGGYWWWTLSQKSLPFWKLVSVHPADALSFFNRNPHCHWEKSKGQDVVGPFNFARPDGQSVPLYIDADHIERVQRDFVELIATKSAVGRGR